VKKYYIFLLISILFLSCSEKNENEIIVDDSELLTQIIGTWKSDEYIITYFPDLTFTDTLFHQKSNAQISEPLYSRNGKFEILDGVVYLMTEHWIFIDSSFIENGISIVPVQAKISIKGNILYEQSVNVLENTKGTKTEIWGSWKNTRWVYHNNPGTKISYTGRQEYYYVFTKDSSKAVYGWKYLDGTPWTNSEFRSEFEYRPPYLSLYGPSEYNMRVEFKFEKMFWYQDNPVLELYKLEK
jgi:hypothetical protein